MTNTAHPIARSLAVTPILLGALLSRPVLGAPAPGGHVRVVSIEPQGNHSAVVKVPANYIYNPRLGAYHDYCTRSPDEFPAPAGPKADFRGPCARHDMCLERHTPVQICNGQLRIDMMTNCDHWYGLLNPLRCTCHQTAALYWAAVTAWTHSPWGGGAAKPR